MTEHLQRSTFPLGIRWNRKFTSAPASYRRTIKIKGLVRLADHLERQQRTIAMLAQRKQPGAKNGAERETIAEGTSSKLTGFDFIWRFLSRPSQRRAAPPPRSIGSPLLNEITRIALRRWQPPLLRCTSEFSASFFLSQWLRLRPGSLSADSFPFSNSVIQPEGSVGIPRAGGTRPVCAATQRSTSLRPARFPRNSPSSR